MFALAAAALALAGRLERARSVWDQAIADARRRGSSSAAGMAGSLRAGVHLRLGALAAAEADLDEMERTRALWPPSAVPVMAAGRATVLLERGEVARRPRRWTRSTWTILSPSRGWVCSCASRPARCASPRAATRRPSSTSVSSAAG